MNKKKAPLKEKKRKCVRCKLEFPVSKGVFLLRGITFACKSCYSKEKKSLKKKKAEVCEFC